MFITLLAILFIISVIPSAFAASLFSKPLTKFLQLTSGVLASAWNRYITLAFSADGISRYSKTAAIFLIPFLMMSLGSCMSFRSEMEGSFHAVPAAASERAPVSVFFHFSHLEQEKGFDVVPKIIPPRRGFRDIFGESMKQLSNVGTFATFTDSENDIDDVGRRARRDSLKRSNDVTIHLTFTRENSFAKHVLGSIVSYGTAAIVPVGYSWEYIITADVSSPSGKLIRTYTRRSSLTTWYQALLLFVYPFLPSEVKIEEIYLESLQNIFRQMESDGMLALPFIPK